MGDIGSSALAFVRAGIYVALTLPLMPAQALFVALGLPAARALPRWYHARCATLFGLDIRPTGTPAGASPTLFVANHVSYLDIVVLSALAEVSFVAKTEIAGWPFFGWLAKLQRTVFVARRARAVGREADALQQRLAAGGNIVLFAEGTTGDGNRAQRFKSALFAAAEPAAEAPASRAFDAAALGLPTDADSIADGREIAVTQCSSCHALDQETSPRPGAPPLRYVLSIHNPESLAEDFRAGIHVGHPDMPDFEFGDLGMDVLLSYLISIQETPPAE